MFEIINESGNTIDNIDVLYEFIDYLVLKENLDDAIFNIIFIDNKKIQEINKQYRHIDAPTDVISFALEDTEDCCISEYRVLGDIYISLDKAKEQVKPVLKFKECGASGKFVFVANNLVIGYNELV